MVEPLSKYIIIVLLCVAYTTAFDDIDLELENGIMGKLMRAMENNTIPDTLNLPANASSIRENITDTFSCENRTYGYYADVDNDCQVFHVCLPSQTTSGRSIVYRWSFICPNETVFNQEVLVCTRPRDAINCEDSPNYYYLNMEIGKETNDTKSESGEKDNTNTENVNKEPNKNTDNINKDTTETKERNREKIKQQRRKPANKKKQNLIVQSLLKESINEKKKEDLTEKNAEDLRPELIDIEPIIEEVISDDVPVSTMTEEDFENARLYAERSLKTKSRKLKRGLFRFKADV